MQEAVPTMLFSWVAADRDRGAGPTLMIRVDAPTSRCFFAVHTSGGLFNTMMTTEGEKKL